MLVKKRALKAKSINSMESHKNFLEKFLKHFSRKFWLYVQGVFRNNIGFFNNFTMLCSMVIKIISMCFRIFLPSFPRVWFSSDDLAQNFRLSKRVTNMNPEHVKGLHDVNEVAIFWLMNMAVRKVHFLSRYFPQKAMDCLYRCIHRFYTSL